MATRGRKPGKNRKRSDSLINAIEFISLAQSDIGAPYARFCKITDNVIRATNGVLHAGAPISEDIKLVPETKKLLQSLKLCGDKYSITKLASERISIKSGKIKMTVPCIDDHNSIPTVEPDEKIVDIDNRLREGFEKVVGIANEDSDKTMLASVLMRSGTVLSTNKEVLVEYYHGNHVPKFAIPAKSIKAILKCGKDFTGLGFSANTVTFYFSDESWLKTQVMEQPWQDVDSILNSGNPILTELPESFVEHFVMIGKYHESNCNEKVIYFHNECLASSKDSKSEGMLIDSAEIVEGTALSTKALLPIIHHFNKADWGKGSSKSFLLGENIRAVIMGRDHVSV